MAYSRLYIIASIWSSAVTMTLSPSLYPIPRERLSSPRSAELAFADAVYCLAAADSRASQRMPGTHSLVLDFPTVTKLTGLDRGTVNEEADKATAAGWLRRSGEGQRDWEEVYLPAYAAIAEGRGAPLKPRNYVLKGWLSTVYRLDRSYLLQQVLNLVWFQGFGPDPRAIGLAELRRRANPKLKRLPNLNRVREKVRTLEQLGLLLPEADGYRIDRACFDQTAPTPDTVMRRPNRQRVMASELFRSLAERDSHRAQQAVDVLLRGGFDPERDLASIFDDLRWAGDNLDLLLRLARGRPRNDKQPNWKGLWRNFERKRQAEQTAHSQRQSARFVAPFDQTEYYQGPLALMGLSSRQIVRLTFHARLRAPLSTRQNASATGQSLEARLTLAAGDVPLLEATLTSGGPLDKSLPLDQLDLDAPLGFMLTAYTTAPVRGLELQAWLEAELDSAVPARSTKDAQ